MLDERKALPLLTLQSSSKPIKRRRGGRRGRRKGSGVIWWLKKNHALFTKELISVWSVARKWKKEKQKINKQTTSEGGGRDSSRKLSFQFVKKNVWVSFLLNLMTSNDFTFLVLQWFGREQDRINHSVYDSLREPFRSVFSRFRTTQTIVVGWMSPLSHPTLYLNSVGWCTHAPFTHTHTLGPFRVSDWPKHAWFYTCQRKTRQTWGKNRDWDNLSLTTEIQSPQDWRIMVFVSVLNTTSVMYKYEQIGQVRDSN